MNLENQEIPQEAKRVMELNKEEIYDLAEKEDKFRDILKKSDSEERNLAADVYSTAGLEKIEAEKKNLVDGLTGVYNKNFFNQEFPKLLSGERRHKRNCAIIVVDLDNLKKINDTCGHKAGDKTLKEAVMVICQSVRKGDHCLRYGGDEFVVLLADTQEGDAKSAAERIRSNIDLAMRKNEIDISVTGSIGYVDTRQLPEWQNDDDEISTEAVRDEMFAMADAAMYKSKNLGRNRATGFDAEDGEMQMRLQKKVKEMRERE